MAGFLASLLCALSVNTASAQRDMSLCLLPFPLLRVIRRALYSALVMACRSAIAALSLDSEYGAKRSVTDNDEAGRGRDRRSLREVVTVRDAEIVAYLDLHPSLNKALCDCLYHQGFNSALTSELWV